MKKRTIRLTESDLHRIVRNSVKRILRENVMTGEKDYENDDYDPWMNGTASFIDGSYDIPYGFHVEIDSSYSTVSIEDPNDEENRYFLQGDEADDLIKDICKYWESSGDKDQEEAVNAVISGLF